MSQSAQSFVIEVPAARSAAVLKLLQIATAGRHTFAVSAAEAEDLGDIAWQLRMQLLRQGAREQGAEAVPASN